MNKGIEAVYEMDESLLAQARALAPDAGEKTKALYRKEMPFTGWVGYADAFPEEELTGILEAADEIAAKCRYFVVIGIGGSYLGARAALSFIDREDSVSKTGRPEVVFAGFNLSGTYHAGLIEKIKDDDVCLLIISKSGGTLEPSVAFLALKGMLIEKYGHEEAMSRIYAITDRTSGKLRLEAEENGYKTFVLPSDIGGRFSVLTPVGLLPLAVAGVDVRAVLDGAKAANTEGMIERAGQLACVRAVLEKQKCVQTVCFFDPSAEDFTAWLLQLFGESEGKDGRGVLPVGVGISRDLHSLGQFFQDGKQVFYETLLFVEEPTADIRIDAPSQGAGETKDGGPSSHDTGDGASASHDTRDGASASPIYGRTYSEFNRAVLEGMTRAHREVGVPIIRVYIPDNSAYAFGQLVYFFELACALTGLLMGVNPFDQPGVEAYKKGMLDYLAGA
ncbi:MAG: glucose-6-phosphate isomerase [Clostridiales bacterium]|nr:glucose-6-phosphate isomerase [Clostridiales bacterium]